MKLTLENTSKIVQLNGIPARVWEGHTDSGVPVHAFISRVAVKNDQDHSQFERELQECRTPSADVEALPARLVL